MPGSNREPELRAHRPKAHRGGEGAEAASRDDSHTLVIETRDTDTPVLLPVRRGSVTVHDERIVHGSGGNVSDAWRKTYVVAYRDVETIRRERAIGFTHSHNDAVDWKAVLA